MPGNWHIPNGVATMAGCCGNPVAPLGSLLPFIFIVRPVNVENNMRAFFLLHFRFLVHVLVLVCNCNSRLTARVLP